LNIIITLKKLRIPLKKTYKEWKTTEEDIHRMEEWPWYTVLQRIYKEWKNGHGMQFSKEFYLISRVIVY